MLLGAAASAPADLWSSPNPPIRIDVGRQLFVDDYLISTTSFERSFHKPHIHEASPVLEPATSLEMGNGYCPVACPFQDGVFYDPKDRLYKMWYEAGWFDGTALAIQGEDGLRWTRPNLDIEVRAQTACYRAAIRSNATVPEFGSTLKHQILSSASKCLSISESESRRTFTMANLIQARQNPKVAQSIRRLTGSIGQNAIQPVRAVIIPTFFTIPFGRLGFIRSARTINVVA